MKKTIVIVPGDPGGIGGEITLKAVSALRKSGFLNDIKIFFDQATLNRLKFGFPDLNTDTFTCISIEPTEQSYGETSLYAIRKAVDFCLEDSANRVMVTGPINKFNIKSCIGKPLGHTEILSEYTQIEKLETVFCLENIKVFFLSRHLSLVNAIKYITFDTVFEKILSMNKYMQSLGYKQPKLAVAGLNPHAGDSGMFGDEESAIILPAILKSRESGLNVEGPIGADSVFHQGVEGRFDAILSLYHDQGHIALKTRDFYGTVTMTLGMPFLRCSVDHGTAEDIAWQGKANPKSMLEAIKLAVSFS